MLRPLRGLGFHKTAVGLRPLCGFAPAHFFAPVKMLCIFLFGRKKTSHTTGTLYEIQPEFIVEYNIDY